MVVNTTNSCLKLAFVQYLPYMIFGGNRDGSVLRGAIIEINKIIMAHLGYCVEYVKAPDEAAGILLPNGSWTGIIRQVVQKEVDMSGVAIAVTYDRNRFVDPTDYLFIDEWTAAFQRPVLKSDVTGFIKPFSDYVWLLIALALVGVLLTEWLLRASHSAIRKLFCLHSQVVMDGHDSNTGLRIFAIFLSQCKSYSPKYYTSLY
ncbi:uncharacterized protein LOC122247774 [Penaeus japonicus]|uniref:uncharacterized protein LOC122247774 n=1 Tax=Penaeus japonicus TaxID=27405 RepID=UPI001C716CF9|nr:uncharacterized protein LOC122247774 [Penaeus japonicus]